MVPPCLFYRESSGYRIVPMQGVLNVSAHSDWKKTQLLTSKGLHGCPRRLRPPALELFCTHSSLGKIGKEEPWTLEIISYWSDKLSSILDYFTFDPQKSILPIQRKSQVLFVYHVLESPRVSEFRSPRVPRPRVPTSPSPRVPASPRPTSHVPVPRPRPTFSNSPEKRRLQTVQTVFNMEIRLA